MPLQALLLMANLDGPKAEAENAKQIITLSTGAVAFTVTFLEKFRTHAEGTAIALPRGLYLAWILFGLTIGFALWYLMALTGNISAVARKENGWPLSPAEQQSADGDETNTRWPGLLMVGAFLLAILAMIWVGFDLANSPDVRAKPQSAVARAKAQPELHQ